MTARTAWAMRRPRTIMLLFTGAIMTVLLLLFRLPGELALVSRLDEVVACCS